MWHDKVDDLQMTDTDKPLFFASSRFSCVIFASFLSIKKFHIFVMIGTYLQSLVWIGDLVRFIPLAMKKVIDHFYQKTRQDVS